MGLQVQVHSFRVLALVPADRFISSISLLLLFLLALWEQEVGPCRDPRQSKRREAFYFYNLLLFHFSEQEEMFEQE